MKIQSINPFNNEVNAEIDAMSTAQALDACRTAASAFPDWKKLDISQRCDHFSRLSAVLRKDKEKYASLATREMGKPITQSRDEIEKCAWAAEVFIQSAATWLQDEQAEADGIKHLIRFEPFGAILGITPWTYPFWEALRFAIPTLAAGNTVVLRPSNRAPLCAQSLANAFEKAGFPKGVFNLALTDHDTVASLIASPTIAAVSVSGSQSAGTHVARLAAGSAKKCVLNLGGSDAFIVLEDANIDAAVAACVHAKTQNAGQRDTAAKRIIVNEKIVPEFSEKLNQAMQSLILGDPMDEKTQIGPLAFAAIRDDAEKQVQDAQKKGAKARCGASRKEPGFFYEPTVLMGINQSMRIWNEESFGPIAPIYPVLHLEQAIQVANGTEFGLGASVWTDSLETGQLLADQLQTGMVFVNHVVRSDPRLPFGGTKSSGHGRQLGKWGAREFCNVKAINVYNP
ncbi:aldehyde dehydrogenase family protein [Candidatus Micrarchaeota archaeon]|nr:aldehyde dehydrogenase family protein [Candidatus Micrarchaeota archaeon]